MEEQIISFYTAQLAKEKGFDPHYDEFRLVKMYKTQDHETYACVEEMYGNLYRHDYVAVSQSLLQKWLREQYRIDVEAYSNASGYSWILNKSFNKEWFSGGTHLKNSDMSGPNSAGAWDTYEEAFEQGLFEALNLI